MNDSILATLIEAIAVYKEKISDLDDTFDLLKGEVSTNQDEILKAKETLQKQIEDTIIITQKMIDKAISNIQVPEAQQVDYNRIEASIKAKINRFMAQKDSDIEGLRADLKEFVIANLARFKPEDGKDADNNLIIKELQAYILGNKSEFKGARGENGSDGRNGSNGVGIEDITKSKDEIKITLTDGTVKKFSVPKTTIYAGGGGGGGINLSTIKTIDAILDTDFIVLKRGEELVKISAIDALQYFGTTPTTPDGAYVNELGSYYVNESNEYLILQ